MARTFAKCGQAFVADLAPQCLHGAPVAFPKDTSDDEILVLHGIDRSKVDVPEESRRLAYYLGRESVH
jgi:hypothetical protein